MDTKYQAKELHDYQVSFRENKKELPATKTDDSFLLLNSFL
jgi:hypothetical protein